VQLPGTAGNGVTPDATKGAKLLSDEPDASKFAGEDEEEDAPRWQGTVPEKQKVSWTVVLLHCNRK
jgi:hypothetical protein